ncbi:MAG: BspA family leucine-rich repeat surface protein, partial [Allomuricauda sp.]
PPNTAPVIKAQTFNAAENISDATIIGTVTATDADKGDKLTFSIATNSSDLFEITNAGALSLATGKTLDFDTKKQHVLSVSVSDGKATAKADVTIKVTEVVAQNQPPVIEAQGFEAAEDIADTDVIGTVVASDPEQDALTFSMDTNDNNLFEITANGELSLAEGKTLDFETAESHAITVGVTDGNGSATATITINVTEVVAQNQAPVIEPQGFEAAENIADTDVIGTVVASDPEQDALTFSISVNDNDLFEIDPSSGELSLASGRSLDFGTAEEHTITVEVTDGVNDPVPAEITITVTAVYDTLAEDPASFVTTWVTTANNEIIVIGVDESLTYDYTIDWGDGTVEDITNTDFIDSTVQHEYAGPGTHTVAIKGTFPAIMMGSTQVADALKLASIEQWGTNPWASMFGAFKNCGNMVYNATDVPDLSQVTNMSHMFNGATAFNGDLSGWNTGSVTNMYAMFSSTAAFNGDISDWDVSSVTDMGFMFYGAEAFNGDISGWDTGNVTHMILMFYEAAAFNRDLGAWDIGSVTDMGSMLSGSGLSPVNYGATILGWATYVQNNNGPSNITLDANGLYYCSGQQSVVGARTFLTDTHGWTINDEGGTNTCN